MPEILTDLSPEALVKANEENIYAFTPFSHNWKRMEVYRGPDICWCITDIRFPMCNAAFHTHLLPEQADNAIEEFLAKGKKKKVPLQWYIGQDSQPTDLAERLAARGFATQGPGAGMAIDLKAMNEDVPPPTGLQIIEVENQKTLKYWCHITCTGFGIPRHVEPTLAAWFKRDMDYKQPLKLYLGLMDGRPVATSMYFLGAGVVGIYFVATLPEARRKGAGYAVTQRALRDGRALGYRAGILQASKMGEPVYRRMGFRETHKTMNYSWLPESEKKKAKKGT